MSKRINKEIGLLMGKNLRRMRQQRAWSQEQLADLTGSDKRYISAMENGRGIGKNMLDRLCGVFGVEEEAFTLQPISPDSRQLEALPRVTRMILEELETMPEYDQLRVLAAMVEKRMTTPDGESGAPPAEPV